ncbi:MAG: 2-methylcitrate dehydratase [Herbaspirillum frisingense]|uniref:2-methylcitrate dehydratase n=1 Tax=Herbaspirillum frisingense TaxID=92645 RepID=A0A7V8FYT2_9BURK|nr:MAG: 2-methylcitrate dehydratase [Herbaspirillum frisingense]
MTPALHEERSAIATMARWIVELGGGDIPERIRAIARDCLIDTLGVITAGSATPVASHARRLAAISGAAGACGVAGTVQRCDLRHAAFANGVAAHALDFDDNCYAGFVHGSAVIAPAALAAAQHVYADGAQLITAFVAGAECEYALGIATANVLYGQGWWTSGVLGPIGACAATAKLLGLDQRQTAAALGLAAAGAAGIKACFGTDGKAFLAGRAAEAGVTAALMAQAGASGPPDAFEHRYGFARLFNGGRFDAQAFDALGRRWTLEDPGVDVKRIPVCLSAHAAVDAVMALAREHGIEVDAIDAISCNVPPIVIANLIHDDPRTPQQAQFSMPFAIAASLLYGTLTLAHLSDATLADGRLRGLMAKVSMVSGAVWEDPAYRATAPEGAEISIALRDGRVLQGFRDFARGAARYPLSAAELDAKFLGCLLHAGLESAQGRGGKRLTQLRALESQSEVRSLFPF